MYECMCVNKIIKIERIFILYMNYLSASPFFSYYNIFFF